VRFVFDAMIYDELLKDPLTLPRLVDMQERREVTIFKTHVQRDEFEAISDESARRKRLALYDALGSEVPTEGMVWDVSRWDQSKLGGGAGKITVEDILTASRRHAEDALLAATASSHADVFVTEDQRLRKRMLAKNAQVRAWSYAEFVAWVEAKHLEASLKREIARRRSPDYTPPARRTIAKATVDRDRVTGNARHYRDGQLLPPPYSLEIVQEESSECYYLLRLDSKGEWMTDTWHGSIESAMAQAHFEFGMLAWLRFDP
jgi:hypothetical protein